MQHQIESFFEIRRNISKRPYEHSYTWFSGVIYFSMKNRQEKRENRHENVYSA